MERSGPGVGAIVLTLRFPPAAFLYRATAPRVLVDGMPVELPGWGTHLVPVWQGRHLVQVYVPYAIPRKAGRALTEVTLAPGQEVRLEYMAPTVTFAAGSLGAPGEQRSAGASLVRALNIAALALAVVGALVWLLS